MHLLARQMRSNGLDSDGSAHERGGQGEEADPGPKTPADGCHDPILGPGPVRHGGTR